MALPIKNVPINQIEESSINPRLIKSRKFKELVKSIQEFPEMLELRPVVVRKKGKMYEALGGNMRHRAAVEVGLKTIPIMLADHLTPAQQKRFIIADNVGFGEWDWDILRKDEQWSSEPLADWGLELPEQKGFEALNEEEQEFNEQVTGFKRNAVFKSSNKYGIPDITEDMLYRGDLKGLETWATTSAYNPKAKYMYVFQNVSIAKVLDHSKILLSFYTRDFKFERLFEEPDLYVPKFLSEKFFASVTPNYTLYAADPYAFRLYRTFKSRWIGVYMAKAGIPIIPDIEFSLCNDLVDLEYVLCGLPSKLPYISIQLQQQLTDDEKPIWKKHLISIVNRLRPGTIICYCNKYHEFIQGCIPQQKFIFLRSINHQLMFNKKQKEAYD